MELIQSGLTKLPYEISDWLGMRIILYSNEPDNMAAIMDCGGGDLQMLYGAASEASYARLMAVLKDIGEPI